MSQRVVIDVEAGTETLVDLTPDEVADLRQLAAESAALESVVLEIASAPTLSPIVVASFRCCSCVASLASLRTAVS